VNARECKGGKLAKDRITIAKSCYHVLGMSENFVTPRFTR
jgi:hypothetical protein